MTMRNIEIPILFVKLISEIKILIEQYYFSTNFGRIINETKIETFLSISLRIFLLNNQPTFQSTM